MNESRFLRHLLITIFLCFLLNNQTNARKSNLAPSPPFISRIRQGQGQRPAAAAAAAAAHVTLIASNNRDENHIGNNASSSMLRIRRGGSDLPKSSTFWSTQTTSQSPQSSQQQQRRNIHVTDVTEELKHQEKQETKEAIDAFLTRDNRNTFIARVYSILSAQILITITSIFAFAKNPNFALWSLSKGIAVPFLCLLISTISVLFMSVSERARQSSPLKWNLLTIFTLTEAFIVGLISSMYKSKTVISALSSTAAALLSVTGYTLLNKNPKYDLSQWGAGLSSMAMIFIFYGIIHSLSLVGWLPPNFLPYNEIFYSILGASLFSMYLAYHTRLIVSGKHTKYQLNEKDYIFGAVLLYNDLINIFLYLLRALDDRDK